MTNSTFKSAKELVSSHVNLDAYSASKEFIGFVEKSGKHSSQLVSAAIAMFFDFFKNELHDFSLVTSLHINQSLEQLRENYEISDKQFAVLRHLSSLGWIQFVNYDEFGTDYDSEKYIKKISDLWLDFNEYDSACMNIENTEKVLEAVMSIDGLEGHCFLVSKKHVLVVYPHEDVGFGLVNLGNDESNVAGSQFLSFAKGVDGFLIKS